MRKTEANKIYPLSLIQEEIWLSQVTHGSTPLFNIGGYLKINGAIDPDIFIKAHRHVSQENDAFKITLHQGETLPGIVFSDTVKELTLVDFSKDSHPEQAAMAWWEKQFPKPFELYDQLMSRYYLLMVSPTQYYYAVCRHHLTMDGYSYSILGRRLAESYNALINGVDHLEAKPSYSDFIFSDQDYRLSSDYQQAKAYWGKKFSTLPPPIIPRRYAAKFNTISTPSAFSHIWLERDFYNTLINFSKQRGANVFFLMVAVLYTYFLRISDVREFVFSLPLLNRVTPEFKNTLGPFVNVIPIRLSFGLDIDILTFFELIKTELMESFPFQRFPLGEINRVSGIQKTGRGQIFDIGLSYERFDYNTDFNGTSFEVNTMHNGYDQTPLTVAIKEYQKDQDVKLEFYYNLSAFKPGEIHFLMQRMKHLLEQIVENPDTPLERFPFMPEEESHKLVVEFNQESAKGKSSAPFDLFICKQLTSVAEKYPDNQAILFGSHSMTYRDLHHKAAQLGSYIKPLLTGPETIVGIYAHKSVETVIAILSVMKAGAAYVPLDPSYPEDRVRFMIKNSGTSVILTQKKLIPSLLPDEHQTIIAIDDFLYDTCKPITSTAQTSSQSLAYVIYTSGTTGQPKGVMCTHGGLSNLVAAQNRIFSIRASSRVLQFASLSFDASVSEIFTTLSTGATLVMAEKNDLMPGPPLLDTLEKQKITHVTLPPSALAVMEEKALPDLETLVTAGEPCPSRLFQKWGKGRCFINAYGPTEATVCASVKICSQEATAHLPMGKPIDNTSLYVLNQHLEPVPFGVPGQLYIGGAGVARGYLNRPELDREKFIPNPFNHFKGHERLYRTGDLVRFLTDSNMEFIGRVDDQVKVRGYRIELQEVTAILTQHPKVLEAAVIVKKTPSGDKNLVAFFSSSTPATDEGLSAELRQHAKQKLPDYMIPARFIHQETLPHTPTGKIDNKPLETLIISDQSGSRHQKPVTELQKMLISHFCTITNTGSQGIGIYDDFFETGMDSLTAVRFLSLMEKEFNQRIPFSELMTHSTIHSLAKLISTQGGTDPIDHNILVPIRAGGENLPFFCITAGYGDVVKLKTLSNHLGKNQPFFMLQPPDQNGITQSAKELASQYAEKIQCQFPKGPYRLGGYSAGGLIAYETARQISARDGNVELLVMIGAPRKYTRLSRFFNKKIGALIFKFLPDPERISSNTLKILFALFKDQGLQHHLNSLEGYYPRGFKGKINYFQGKWALSRFLGTHRTWMKNAEGEFEQHLIPGNHDSFLKEPYVASLARRLGQCIHALDQEKGKMP